ncbi:MAG: hypothetical protein SVQ76_00960 [Candidatus Nanohaloarchaea archaeon]|nr:hypothetical protein [Candidatus Nanohaloarchaea archaeon]
MEAANAPSSTPAEPVAAPRESAEQDDGTLSRHAPVAATAALTGLGVLGRSAFQHVPSVAPLVAVAVAAGFYGGARHGLASGSTGYLASNFLVWGGQGPWTAFQVGGAALAGTVGAFLGRISGRRGAFLASLVAGTLAYEAAVNLGSLLYMPWLGVAGLAAAVPFAAVHLASTIGFGSILHGFEHKLEDVYSEEPGLHRGGNGPAGGAGGRVHTPAPLPGRWDRGDGLTDHSDADG